MEKTNFQWTDPELENSLSFEKIVEIGGNIYAYYKTSQGRFQKIQRNIFKIHPSNPIFEEVDNQECLRNSSKLKKKLYECKQFKVEIEANCFVYSNKVNPRQSTNYCFFDQKRTSLLANDLMMTVGLEFDRFITVYKLTANKVKFLKQISMNKSLPYPLEFMYRNPESPSQPRYPIMAKKSKSDLTYLATQTSPNSLNLVVFSQDLNVIEQKKIIFGQPTTSKPLI
jgi:hypothetical protein